MRILMVCLGNICRSPLAQGILEAKIAERGLDWLVDSAGTGAYHIGERPDPRSIATAEQHGLDISPQRARQFRQEDFDRFDLILTMDEMNYRDVMRLAPGPEARNKVKMILNYLPGKKGENVPDPYWDNDGFEQVYQLLEEATKQLILNF